MLSPALAESQHLPDITFTLASAMANHFHRSPYTAVIGSRELAVVKEDLVTFNPLKKMLDFFLHVLGDDRVEGALAVMMLEGIGEKRHCYTIEQEAEEAGKDGVRAVRAAFRARDGYVRLREIEVSAAGLSFSLAKVGFRVDREVLDLIQTSTCKNLSLVLILLKALQLSSTTKQSRD